MFCNFLSTCAWCGHFILKASRVKKELVSIAPEVTGNLYLVASSDFIPRNPAALSPHSVADRKHLPEERNNKKRATACTL